QAGLCWFMNSYCVPAITMTGHGLRDYPTTFVPSSPRFEIIPGVFQAEHPGEMEDNMVCMDNPLATQLRRKKTFHDSGHFRGHILEKCPHH
ncbi:MAG TPA: hypothetical protein VN765_14975, partial [Candidatus Acidoferrum sp.]|nr:hypothetical protein [Candidatus Acidoferrum sp.]